MIWLSIAAAVIVAGIIHILAVLGLPYLAENSAWSRLSSLGDANTMLVLPPASASQQTLPLMAPDIRYAFCRYDLSSGPVRLGTQILDDLWMIALYTPHGDNFYTISGGDLKRAKVAMVISTEPETLLQLEADASEDADNVVIVKAPEPTGIAMIRAPLRGPAYAARTELALKRASCGLKPQTEITGTIPPPRRK